MGFPPTAPYFVTPGRLACHTPIDQVLALVEAPGQQDQQRESNLALPMALSNFSSGRETPPRRKTQVRSFQVQSRPNLVLLKNDDDSLAANLTVIYSEPGKCAIFRGNTNPSQCTLYVLTNTSDADINRCESFFPRFCGRTKMTVRLVLSCFFGCCGKSEDESRCSLDDSASCRICAVRLRNLTALQDQQDCQCDHISRNRGATRSHWSAHVCQKSLEVCSTSSCMHQGGCELCVLPVCWRTTNVSLFLFGLSNAGATAARQSLDLRELREQRRHEMQMGAHEHPEACFQRGCDVVFKEVTSWGTTCARRMEFCFLALLDGPQGPTRLPVRHRSH
ncbi:uncharacterized protein ISCGN_017537 [Ixodes scapularis]